jgi:dolichol-phosphate mannosyltransferase
MSKYELTIVAPVFNEEANIKFLYDRLTETLKGVSHEIIFINDGSSDQSIVQVKQLAKVSSHIKYISFSRNFGHQAAVMAGIASAVGDAVVIMDADLQDPPEVIAEFVKQWQKGFHVVYGKRISRDGESFFKKTSAAMFYRLLHWLTEVEIPPQETLFDKIVFERKTHEGAIYRKYESTKINKNKENSKNKQDVLIICNFEI